MYGEATLEPEGDQKEAIDSILGKFPGGGQAGDKLKDADREGPARVGRAGQLQGRHRAVARRRGGVLRELGWAATTSRRQGSGWSRRTTRTSRAGGAREVRRGQDQEHDYKDVEYLTDDSGEAGAVSRRLPRARHGGRGQGRHRHEQGRQEALGRRELQEARSRARPRTGSGSSTSNSPQFLKSAQGTMALPESFEKFFKEPFVATVDADDDGVVFEGKVPGGDRADVRIRRPGKRPARASCPATRGSRWRRPTSGS